MGLLVLTACSLTLIANDKFVEITCEELESSVTVNKLFTAKNGDPFSIYLCGDPSTGKRWSLPEIDGLSIVEFDYTEFVVGLDVA